MSTPAWHTKCSLREEVRTGTLTLAEFAADLYGVRTGDALEVYRDPAMFFSRTYPTHRMKELVREVMQRLAGTGGNPVIRLQVAYGGGKTHSLITLLHLAERAAEVAENTTVKEFTTFAGVSPMPSARVALLPFDKFDVHDGMEVVGPTGDTRRVRTPWGALAYQLAGDAGFARVQRHEETYSTPAQPLLEELLRVPVADGKGALVLLDEAVIYCRAAVNEDPRRLGTLKDFFQLLTQACANVSRACIVATLIASENAADDPTGALVLRALEDVFSRLQTTTEPVGREDVAEVLRRRLFEHVPTEQERRPIVDAVLATYSDCKHIRDAQKDNAAYQRLLQSYPFHPDLLEVFYEKWTGLPGFQRTRGALRLLAQALKQSDGYDPSPFAGVHAFLGPDTGLSQAVTELVRICADKDDTWTPKLSGEMERARESQGKFSSLREREIEQGVLATFLHSQPPGQKTDSPNLYALLVHPGVDLTALESGLEEWRGLSWFLTEGIPEWQLTTTPNLTHMHVNAVRSLGEPRIADELRAQVERVRDLAETERDGADRGVSVHRLPQGPRDVPDSTDLHYLVLGPECAVDPARPVPASVTAYFATTAGANARRSNRNTLVALAPDIARLAGLRKSVTDVLAWQAVEASDGGRQLSAALKRTLAERKRTAEDHLPGAVRATYSVVLDLDEDGNVRAQALKSADSLGILDTRPFARIKAMLKAEERLLTADLDPELLLPESYFELWSPGEESKKAQDLQAAFAQFPRLPRFLSSQAFREILARGCETGVMVLRLPRPDGTARTLWRVRPTVDELTRSELEIAPASQATLTELEPTLLAPGVLSHLWTSESEPIALSTVRSYFDGNRAPRAGEGVVDAAVVEAVRRGSLWARTPARTYLREQFPTDALADTLELLPPPPAVAASDLLPDALPQAWGSRPTTLARIVDALGSRRGYLVPWTLVTDAVNAALQSSLLKVTGGIWPCSPEQSAQVEVDLAERKPPEPPRPPKGPRILAAEAGLTPFELQKLGEIVDQLAAAAPTAKLSFNLLLTVEGGDQDAATIQALNDLLSQASKKLRIEGEQSK